MPELDFFDSEYGNLRPGTWRSRRVGGLTDWVFDLRLQLNRTARGLGDAIAAAPRQRILIVGIEAPTRKADIHTVIDGLSKCRHTVDTAVVEMGQRSKFANLNQALNGRALEAYDWIIVTDDDITTPDGLLDTCLYLAARTDLRLFQPAHRFKSFAAFEISHRHWNSLVRTTRFVEIGPLTALHRSTFGKLLPFPEAGMGYGLDLYWSEICRREGWNMGIIDAASIRHLRPVGQGYGRVAAIEEGRRLLQQHNITRKKSDFLQTETVFRALSLRPVLAPMGPHEGGEADS